MRLIDADALIYDEIDDDLLAVFKHDIDDAPTVDAVPVRHGKWIYGEDRNGADGYYCSECHKHVRWHYKEEHINFIYNYSFCPHCGARMDEDETDRR